MKKKFNVKGFIKNSMLCVWNGMSLAMNSMEIVLSIAGTVICIKDKKCRPALPLFALLTSTSIYNWGNNIQTAVRVVDGEIGNYDWYIYEPDEKELEDIKEV